MLDGMENEPQEPKPAERSEPAPASNYCGPPLFPPSEEEQQRYDEIAKRIAPIVERAKRRRKRR